MERLHPEKVAKIIFIRCTSSLVLDPQCLLLGLGDKGTSSTKMQG